MNVNWPRWIFASFSKHFDDRRGSLPLFIEGQHRDTKKDKDFIELRVDGPWFTEVSKGYWRVFSEVNVLIQSTMDDTNYHRIHTSVGIVVNAFTTIEIYKYGTGPDDDQSLLSCFRLLQDERKRRRIAVNHFGQLDTATKLLQASVEGHYEMFLRE